MNHIEKISRSLEEHNLDATLWAFRERAGCW